MPSNRLQRHGRPPTACGQTPNAQRSPTRTGAAAYRMWSDSPAGQRGRSWPWTMMQCVGVQGKASGSSMPSVMNRPARMQGSAMRHPLRPCRQPCLSGAAGRELACQGLEAAMHLAAAGTLSGAAHVLAACSACRWMVTPRTACRETGRLFCHDRHCCLPSSVTQGVVSPRQESWSTGWRLPADEGHLHDSPPQPGNLEVEGREQDSQQATDSPNDDSWADGSNVVGQLGLHLHSVAHQCQNVEPHQGPTLLACTLSGPCLPAQAVQCNVLCIRSIALAAVLGEQGCSWTDTCAIADAAEGQHLRCRSQGHSR